MSKRPLSFVEDNGEDHINAIFAAPKDHLAEINIWEPKYDDDAKQTMDIISNGTNAVQSLGYSGSLSTPDAFDKFMAKNKAKLRSICVINMSYKPISKSNIGTMVEKFLDSPHIQDISLVEVPPESVLKTI